MKFWSPKPEKPGLKDHLKGVEAKNAVLRRQLEAAQNELVRIKCEFMDVSLEIESQRKDKERLARDLEQKEGDYSSAILLKVYVSEILGIPHESWSYSWASVREEIKTKLSQLKAQANAANEFRAALAKLQGVSV